MATELPTNDTEFTVDEIVAATGGHVVVRRADRVRGVSTDTRHQLTGKLFVALRGERFDGHGFVGDALRAGASAVLVSEDAAADGGATVVRVPCTLTALGALARYHRRRWGGTLVAVAGSAGKTTTRATLSATLEAAFPGQVQATPGNLNNRVGVPLVLLGLGPEHRIAVVEIGTNATGEVALLTRIAAPEVGVLTLVGLEHAAGLGDLDSIEREEGSLLALLPESGIAVANGDDARALRRLDASPARTRIRYGTLDGCDVRVLRREPGAGHRTRLVMVRDQVPEEGPVEVDCQLLGLPGALAVAAAVAVTDRLAGRRLGAEALGSALARLGSGEPGRLTPLDVRDGTLVLDDSYNSNPASVRASLATAREIASTRGSRLVLVLGEMRELGSLSPDEHTSLGHALVDGELLVAVSGEARRAAAAARSLGHHAQFAMDAVEAVEIVRRITRPGDVILVKGSRSVGLDRVARYFVAREEPAP